MTKFVIQHVLPLNPNCVTYNKNKIAKEVEMCV